MRRWERAGRVAGVVRVSSNFERSTELAEDIEGIPVRAVAVQSASRFPATTRPAGGAAETGAHFNAGHRAPRPREAPAANQRNGAAVGTGGRRRPTITTKSAPPERLTAEAVLTAVCCVSPRPAHALVAVVKSVWISAMHSFVIPVLISVLMAVLMPVLMAVLVPVLLLL